MAFHPPKPVSMTLNLAPMVDVMMCLIIFFLLASRIVDAEHRPVNLPVARSAREPEPEEMGRRVTINVLPAADDPLGADYVVQAWNGRALVERRLPAEDVAAYLQARARAVADDAGGLRCIIRADREVAYGHVEVVLRGCGLARISHVVFAAQVAKPVAQPHAEERP